MFIRKQALALALLASFLCTLCMMNTAWAKYRPLDLKNLLSNSKLIVSGEITKLSKSEFAFKIDKVLHGKLKSKTIQVIQFKNWTCAQRWAPYQVGQKLLLCLNPSSKSSGSFKIRSGGAEGEMPTLKNFVYIHGPSHLPQKFELHKKVYAKQIRAQKISIKALTKEIARLHKTSKE